MSHFLDCLLFFKKKKDTFPGNAMTEQELLEKSRMTG